MQNEPVMGVLAVSLRHPFEQFLLDLDDILARRQAGPVGQPEYVGIDRDCRFAERRIEHNVGGFAADAGQRL